MPALLQIDFASARRGAGRAGRALLIGGVVASVAVVVAHRELHAELAAVEAQSRSVARQIGTTPGPATLDPAKARALSLRIAASNRVLHTLDQPWFKLFDDIEAAGMQGIALLGLEPDATQASVRVTGEAQDLDTLSRYLERLSALASLHDVRITQHELREGREMPALRFTVSARWVRSA